MNQPLPTPCPGFHSPAASPSGRPLQLKEKAYWTLKEMLIRGTLAPGSLLSERKLAVQLQMSNTPVRSAIERLEADGFLSISPQQGIRVKEITRSEVDALLELRLALETHVARRLAREAPRTLLGELDDCLNRLSLAVNAGSGAERIQARLRFHLEFAGLHGNPPIVEALSTTLDRLHQVFLVGLDEGADPSPDLENYRSLREALKRGDENDATRALEACLAPSCLPSTLGEGA